MASLISSRVGEGLRPGSAVGGFQRIQFVREFHFRGPAQKMDLKAYNLSQFVQLSEGVDDETWQYHLRRGDYSNWVTHALRDTALAGEIADAEQAAGLPLEQTRARIVAAIKRTYTAPSS